eukprot:553836-Pyramimonas_sp.AAC.1
MRSSGAEERAKYQVHIDRWEKTLERVRTEKDEGVNPPLASGLLKLDAERRPDTNQEPSQPGAPPGLDAAASAPPLPPPATPPGVRVPGATRLSPP